MINEILDAQTPVGLLGAIVMHALIWSVIMSYESGEMLRTQNQPNRTEMLQPSTSCE